MKLNKQGWILVLLASQLWSQGVADDSTCIQIGRLPIQESEEWHLDSAKRYNPVVSTAASLIVPGAGQVYTHHYVKAGFFIALEAILGSMALYWKRDADNQEINAGTLREWSDSATVPLDSAVFRERSFLAHHQAIESRLSSYSFLTWTVGAHLFNVLDALGSSNVFNNTLEKNPSTAGLLAAIPGLGLGQLYNGSYSKAGLVIMGQVSLGMMVYASQRQVKRAEDNYGRLNAAGADTLTTQVASTYSGRWSDARYRSFTNRNMYLWYSVFFYGYSIFDAVVDAYLHEYPERMKIKPDLVLQGNDIHFTLSTTF
jgi:hypothetical protein